MNKTIAILVFCLIFLSKIRNYDASNVDKLDCIFKQLLDKIYSYQALREQSRIPFIRWYEKPGLFQSEIRLNFHGGKLAQRIRQSDKIIVYDNDFFSSGWVVTALLEARLYGGCRHHNSSRNKDAELRLEIALDSLNDFHDRNEMNYSTSLIRTFWPQSFNQTFDLWQIQPINIRNLVIDSKLPINLIEKLLKLIKSKFPIEFLEKIKRGIDGFASIFGITPDFDDTYLNLGLGALLTKFSTEYPTSVSNWLNINRDMKRLIDLTLKYSYKPFSNDSNKNVIDPRTYYYARHFIQEANRSNESLSLFSTWIQNLDEQRVLHRKGISMPFNVNNVDITVCANVIYGCTSAALMNLSGFSGLFLKSSDLVQTYLNSTRFVSWAIQTNFSSRPELASLYYPSKDHNFFLF
jgi:hypothetical protein